MTVADALNPFYTCVVCPERPTVLVIMATVTTRLAMCGQHGAGLLAEGVAQEVTPIEAYSPAARNILYGRVTDFEESA